MMTAITAIYNSFWNAGGQAPKPRRKRMFRRRGPLWYQLLRFASRNNRK